MMEVESTACHQPEAGLKHGRSRGEQYNNCFHAWVGRKRGEARAEKGGRGKAPVVPAVTKVWGEDQAMAQ